MMKILSLSLILCVNGIYFYVPTGGADKCFGEEAYGDAVIHVSYKHENQHGTTCTMTFYDSKGLVLIQRILQDANGSVATVVPADSKGGQFKICLKCPGSRWTENEPQKFQIKIDVGGRSLLDGAEGFAKADDVKSVENKAKAALDRITTLARDGDYERITETAWRDESDKTNSSVKWLHVFSIILIVVIACIQAMSLKNYFRREKLIF